MKNEIYYDTELGEIASKAIQITTSIHKLYEQSDVELPNSLISTEDLYNLASAFLVLYTFSINDQLKKAGHLNQQYKNIQ